MRALAVALALVAAPAASQSLQQEAKGSFDVKVAPVSAAGELPRLSIDKTYHGDLEGTGTGQMLADGDGSKSHGAYVAIEIVRGTIKGRTGSFTLAHRGTMGAAGINMSVIIVPESGTDGLAGIEGDLDIKVEGGKHFYTLHYRLPPAK